MATNPIKLVINRQAKALVTFNGSASAIPPMFQSNTLDFEVSAVDPATSVTANPPYILADLGSFGLRVAIGPTPTGTAGGPTVLAIALPAAWSWDATNKKFIGSLALNTVDVDAYIGALPEKSATFEVNLTFGASRITLFQGSVTLKAVVDELLSLVPTPVDSFLTANESKALFMRKVGLAGERQVYVSEDGTKGREVGVNNDGSGIDNYFPI